MSTSPSDYSCPDGDMQICMNLVNNGNELIPVGTPQKVLNLNKKVVAVHLVGSERHFILQDGTMFYWCSSDFVLHEIGEISGQIFKVEKIGNTLIFLTDSGMKYYLWKGSSYSYLGDHFPELDLMFALDGKLTTKRYTDYSVKITQESSSGIDYSTLIKSVEITQNTSPATHEIDLQLDPDTYYKIEISKAFVPLIGTLTFYGMNNGQRTKLFSYGGNSVYYFTVESQYTSIELDCTFTSSSQSYLSFPMTFYKGNEEAAKYRFENTSENFTAFMAANADFIARAAKEGKFIYPFFVRYAYRLYDGTVTHQSAPVLMYPTFNIAPLVFFDALNLDKSTLTLSAPYCDLQYKVLTGASLDLIKDSWSDIIKEIVFYVSSPIYSINQGENFDSLKNKVEATTSGNFDRDVFTVSRIRNDAETVTKDYARHDLMQIVNEFIGESTSTKYMLIPPSFTDAQNIESVANTYTFYELKKISPSNLKKNSFTTIPIEQDYLTFLNTRDSCSDDYKSHNTFVPETSFVFNSRLIIASIYELLFKGFNPAVMSGFGKSAIDDGNMTLTYSALVYINSEEGVKTVYSPDVGTVCGDIYWFFYPDSRAFKAVIQRIATYNDHKEIKTSEIELIAHDFLNGAYWYGGELCLEFGSDSFNFEVNASLYHPNMLYTSSVNNPFYFPAIGMESIDGNIVGLSSAVTALSQGQYGDFPLYAFTDKGIWALSPNSEGTFIAKQPIPREVCNNPSSITQIDNAVVFSSDKGLMLLSGSACVCLSSVFDNSVMQVSLPGITNFYDDNININFIDFIKSARIAYDYAHQRLVIFQPEGNTFVYSLSSKTFTMLDRAYSSVIQNYPECYVMDSQNNLLNLSVENQDDVSFFILSRPFQPSSHLTTIQQTIQRGLFKDLKMVLYGSRDFKNWFVVASSSTNRMGGFSGTPYRAFRMLLSGNMEYSHAISELCIKFIERETNRLR